MISLTKWYCDCVDPEGGAFIGYWARLSWGPFAIPYVASLYKPPAGPVTNRCALRSVPPPADGGGRLQWSCAPLGLEGSWTASAPAYRRTLLDDARGSIAWACEFPAADAVVQLGPGCRVAGAGYAECLTVSLLPQHLPFDELRWGRFVSAEDVLTWIDWRGATPRRWVFHNGIEVGNAVVEESRVRVGRAGDLELADGVLLREGRLATTALRSVPLAERWLLRGIAGAVERKWLARATFRSGARRAEGWAIHEVVRLRG